MNLPDTTMVKLQSGRTVSLGTLRSEHRARLLRFSRAAALGSTMAMHLAAHSPGPTQQSQPPADVRPAPTPGPKIGGMTKANTSVGAAPNVANPNLSAAPKVAVPMMVPFHPLAGITLAKDYLDFCTAAHPSVCIYLPPDSSFGETGTRFVSGTLVLGDLDTLIFDEKTCKYDGGVFAGSDPPAGCWFYYPSQSIANFLPKGPLTKSFSCDAPGAAYVDPKGAVIANVNHTGFPVTTDSRPITCVVQVWVGG
jgi:hypothetical protein